MLFLLLGNSSVFAQWKAPELKLSNSYRYLLREHHGIYIQRGEVEFSYCFERDMFSRVKISPFIELRNNLQKDRLEHKEIGLTLGLDLTPWFYIAESLQYTRYNYDWINYIWHQRIKYATEAETHVMFSFPVKEIGQDKQVRLYLLDELTYSFRLDEVTRNETVVGFMVPLVKHLEGNFSWRHIDRVHDFDSDALELTLSLIF